MTISCSGNANYFSWPEMKVVKFDKRRQRNPRGRRSVDSAKILTITAAVIVVVSAAIWLVRDARDLRDSFRPAEGSLVVNVNTAVTEELISIPGIGSARAAQIIAGRPYATVDELAKIAGIGPETLESLRPFVSVDGETRPRN